ncbi:ComF family protein [Ketogulonicigenium vulgare]|uniref:ComF family protein n=1 Tax=Ketogulonicigenium vulgare TaxID=92945 RepID=UPI0023594B40|nr:double zinc ribbon domain-containing protein [Ketogulonicigenium vulgare]
MQKMIVGRLMDRIAHVIYPPGCMGCAAPVVGEHALCGPCWAAAGFIAGASCTLCAVPLPGAGDAVCDACLYHAPPWDRGRALMVYEGLARQLILQLKHADRTDLAPALSSWLLRRAGDWLPGAVIVPVPLHWTRLLRRRYNQAALLAQGLAARGGADVAVDALVRLRRTKALEGHSRAARYRALDGAIHPHPQRGVRMEGRDVVIVDDVMTSGATLAAATLAARAAGATSVSVLALARVVKSR